MSACSLRAARVDGKGFFSFTLDDAPCHVGSGQLILLRRKMTPILKWDTVELSSDLNAHVNDIVLSVRNQDHWIVQYDAGFVGINLSTGERCILCDLRPFTKVRAATEEERMDFSLKPFTCSYRFEGQEFTLDDIIGYHDGMLIIKGFDKLIHPLEITQYMGFSVNKVPMFLGEKYKGYEIVLCYGRVCVQTKLGVMDIQTKKYFLS